MEATKTTYLAIPNLSLVVLIGASGSGKSTFARRHFKPTEVLSSDSCRGLVADDENDQSATNDAFDVLHYVAAKRLKAGRLTVVDATNVQLESRKPLVALAREHHCLPVAIVFNLPEALCQERNRLRPDRDFGPHVVRRQTRELRQSLRNLKREGFQHVFVLDSADTVDAVTVQRVPLYNDRRQERGPFDVVGDVHGCFDELVALLDELGYELSRESTTRAEPVVATGEASAAAEAGSTSSDWPAYLVRHPDSRRLVLLGDLVDRGPKIAETLRLVMDLVASGQALCLPGNHDAKLLRALRGRNVQVTHGLAESLAQLDREPPGFKERVAAFLDSLVSHYVLDGGKLVVAHAGLTADLQGRASRRVRDFALYGETTGETDELGLPVRQSWATEYRGPALVVYGHTPVAEPEWVNGTINVDTGCVFGGRLTALRYPERELVSIPAQDTYYVPSRPFLAEPEPPVALSTQHQVDELLDLDEVVGKRIVATRLFRTVTIREENARAALEVMSRFAANPKWLVYLPPTMSPPATTSQPGLLEHLAEALAYYRHEGIPRVVCEEKHMGSRAVVIVCRDEDAARRRFGVVGESFGICYTRTGRRFFDDSNLETELLGSVRAALDASDLWAELRTDWVVLDCELLPWSVKAQELLRRQYAAVGAASRTAISAAVTALRLATARNGETQALLDRFTSRSEQASQFVDAYRRFCWPVTSIADLRLAPFHLLASEGAVHWNRDHVWHLETLARLATADPGLLVATLYRVVDVTDAASEAGAVEWWEALTERGGEGAVVKPVDWHPRGRRGIVQPGVKCRGREYLRIIYGPEYTTPENLDRLRSRGLSAKRSLALREYALGVEALERFVRREPLRRVHECVFGVLALESEPVDPRL